MALKNTIEELEEFIKFFQKNSLMTCTQELKRAVEYLHAFAGQAKFKVGDLVELVEDEQPDKSSGWYCYRDCLIASAKATVNEVNYDTTKSCFYYSIQLMFTIGRHSSFVRSEAQYYVVEPACLFMFNESKLQLATSTKTTSKIKHLLLKLAEQEKFADCDSKDVFTSGMGI